MKFGVKNPLKGVKMIKKRLIKLLPQTMKYILAQVLWNWLSLLCQIAMIYEISKLLTYSLTVEIEKMNFDMMLHSAGIIGISIALRIIFDILAVKASYKAGADVKRVIRRKIYEKLLRLGISYREQISTAAVIQMSVEGVEQLEIYFGRYLSQLFYSLLAPVTLFIFLSRINLMSALVLLLCVPLIPLSIVAVQKIANSLLKKYWGIYTGLGDSFLENLQGMTALKIYGADGYKAEEMDEEAQQFRKITMKVLTMQLNSTSVMDIIAYGGAAVGMMVALQQFLSGNISPSGTLTICLLASEFFIPLRLLGSFFHIAMNGMAASDNMFDFFDLKEPAKGEINLKDMGSGIRIENLSFQYDESRRILNDINIEFPVGSITSLVGASGSGKSTIAGILTGRNKGYSGNVKINGRELSAVDENSIMSLMTLVSGNSYIFKGTVRDNLQMGSKFADDKTMMKSLETVNLKDFLETQKGLDTEVLEAGSNFSGGQKQRLALARAILHDTPVYIFDEATSNIDVESEEMIMKVIYQLSLVKTVILISHRLANVVSSDNIYVLHNGRVEQCGTHPELMEKPGRYRQLYDSQHELEEYGKKDGRI